MNIMNPIYYSGSYPKVWFSSYLHGRTFAVKLGNTISSSHPVLLEIPQG